MKVDLIRIFDRDVDELVEVFIPLVLGWAGKTLIPELYEVFGAERLMRFLDLFAGTRFEVPSREVLLRALRDAEIYRALAAERDSLAGLSRKFGIDECTVQEAYERAAGLLNGVNSHGNGNGNGRRPPGRGSSTT